MATWSSNPSVPHTGGTFEFPKNTGSNSISYTISYTSDTNCTASTICVVPAGESCQPKKCNCDDFTFTGNIEIPYDGGTGILIGTYTVPDKCDGTITANTSSEDWVTNISCSNGNVNANVSKHTGELPRNSTITLSTSDGCTLTATVTQKADTNCDSKYRFIPFNNEVDAVGGGAAVATVKPNAPALTVTSKPDWVTSVTTAQPNTNVTYLATCSINDSDEPREGTITFSSSDGCTFTSGTIKQKERNWVDMGPGAGLWCKYNVGATKPTEYGKYYQYGAGTANTTSRVTSIKYYGTENPLDPSKDTARQVMGQYWRMPTKEECKKLISNSIIAVVTYDNFQGIEFIRRDKRANKIFFPLAGGYNSEEDNPINVGQRSWILTSTPHNENCFIMRLSNEGDPYAYADDDMGRDNAISVRGIIELPQT
jgi:hypothetical protein